MFGSKRTLGRQFPARSTLSALAVAAGAALTFIAVSPALAQADLDFAGEEIELMVPYGPGGGSNTHNRLFVLGLQQTLPGQPTIVVRNVEGGGSITGTNEFAARAEPDGRAFIGVGSSTILNQILRDPSVRYDLGEFIPFLSSPGGSIVYARSDFAGGLTDDPIENIRKAIENPPTIASQTITSSDIGMLLSYDLLGIKPKVVFGIGLGESRAGLERGEFQMRHDTMFSYGDAVAPLVEEGSAKLLFTMGYEENGEMVRDPMVPDVPHFLEVYEAIYGEPLSGIEYDVWKSLFNVRVMAGKVLMLPAGTPPEIVEIYAQATRDALELPVMQDGPAQLIIGDYPQVTGAEATSRIMEGALSLTPEHLEWLKAWAAETHGATF